MIHTNLNLSGQLKKSDLKKATWAITETTGLLVALASLSSTRYKKNSSNNNRMRWNEPNDWAERSVRSRIIIELQIKRKHNKNLISFNLKKWNLSPKKKMSNHRTKKITCKMTNFLKTVLQHQREHCTVCRGTLQESATNPIKITMQKVFKIWKCFFKIDGKCCFIWVSSFEWHIKPGLQLLPSTQPTAPKFYVFEDSLENQTEDWLQAQDRIRRPT